MPLSDAAIRHAQPREKLRKLYDSRGLYLGIAPRGSKAWRFKYRFADREKRISLGLYPEVPSAGVGRHADGNGLYLFVQPSGTRSWIQRLVVRGRRRELGLGSVALVSLAEAREKALANRKLAREGGDPLAPSRLPRVAFPRKSQSRPNIHPRRPSERS